MPLVLLQLGSRGWVLSLESCHARCVDPATKRRLATFECLSLIEGEAILSLLSRTVARSSGGVPVVLTWYWRRSGSGRRAAAQISGVCQ